MKKLLFLILLLSLSACALPQKQPIIAQGKKYYDPNVPSINLNFPFNVFHQKEEVKHGDHSRNVSNYLTTDKNNIYLYINKSTISGNWYYTGADNKMKYKQYEHKAKKDSCVVYIFQENLKSFLLGVVYDHKDDKTLNKIVMGKRLGYVSNPDRWALEHGDEIDDFITDFKKICFQLVK